VDFTVFEAQQKSEDKYPNKSIHIVETTQLKKKSRIEESAIE
jgi:hypothetical protein